VLFSSIIISLNAFEMPKFKTSVNLGTVNGGSIGIMMGNRNVRDKIKHQERFINVDYYKHPHKRGGGLNGEIHIPFKMFYGLLEMGCDYMEQDLGSQFWANPPDDNDFEKALYPHVELGVGVKIKLDSRRSIFIKYDFGSKVADKNINFGLIL